MPIAVARPRSTEEIQAIVIWANRHRIGVVARGAGSGLAGGCNAEDGTIVLSLQAMNRLIEINTLRRSATVEPGLITGDLKRAAQASGLFYPPDPASSDFCTIGGNIATNAGGLCCVKYGVTRDYVRSLEVVLADGKVLKTGTSTDKGVAGYDLTSLLVGSEGTLGIITKAVLRLVRKPASTSTLFASFAEAKAAVDASLSGIDAGVDMSMLELMDQVTVRAVEDLHSLGLDRNSTLIVAQSDGVGSVQEIELLRQLLVEGGASDVVTTSDPWETAELLVARRSAFPALERLGTVMLDDVCLPRDRVAEMLAAIETASAQFGVLIGTFGHLGDGNLHPTIVFNASDEGDRRSAQLAFSAIIEAALALEGTITGEHGVGRLKSRYLASELDGTAFALHEAIKATFDPLGILNPGAMVRPTAAATTKAGR
jgi:glycolate oxidase